MEISEKKPQFAMLILLASFASVGATLFTPALPSIQAYFHLSVQQAQLTITCYLFGYALGQLAYGPLANRYGRKPALYMGLFLSIVGSLFCALSATFDSFGLLVGARFVQAIGACAGLKISFTMIGDAYDQKEGTKIISRTLMAFAIIPGVATAIGGWLTEWFNWQSCFYFLALFGAMMLWLSMQLPETAKSLDRGAMLPSSIIRGYGLKLKNSRLIISALMMGCGTAVIYVFAAKAPFIGIRMIGLSPEQFGAVNLIPSIGILTGSILASRLANVFVLSKVLLIGIGSAFAMTMLMLIPFAMGVPTTWSLFVPMIFIYAAETIIYANVSSFGLATAKNKSNASAMMNFLNMGMAFLATLVAQFVYPESEMLLPISFLCLFLTMLLLWLLLRRVVKT